MKKYKGRIAVDQDEVLAKLIPKWLKYYNNEYNDNLKPDDITNWKLTPFVKLECGDKIYEYILIPNFYRDLEVVENSQKILKDLSNDYEVFVVTDAMYNEQIIKSKVEWLQEHFSFIPKNNIVFCGNKGIVMADYLIDDGLHNHQVFKGKGLLYDMPYNKHYNDYLRVKNWLEIEDYFRKVG